MTALVATDIDKTYRSGNNPPVRALEGVSVHVKAGEFVSIIGPSGCGKSTLLNVLTGLERPDRGRVYLRGEDVTGRRGLVAYMPQRDALLPWRSVVENAVLAATVQHEPVAAARQEAHDLLGAFGLDGFGDALPVTLSGGMRQRAALLRTVLWKRTIMLLDEPFGALDALTRAHLQQWLLGLWHSLDRTIVLVTHDVDEALLLSDRVYVFSPRPGRVALDMKVTLPRPRSFDMIMTTEFSHLKASLLRALGQPVHPAHPVHPTDVQSAP